MRQASASTRCAPAPVFLLQTDYFHLFICVAIVVIYGDDVIEQQLPTDQMLLHFSNLAMHMNGELVLRKVNAHGLMWAESQVQEGSQGVKKIREPMLHLPHLLHPPAVLGLGGDSAAVCPRQVWR